MKGLCDEPKKKRHFSARLILYLLWSETLNFNVAFSKMVSE